ncbi:Peptide-N(4)-(N-acetyl-beta-glucosaminyl)asparagine amidase [Brachionus plicatilis]|uniref:Peptide-N(4)-(N-acetyl-beta-glucosaminyl)asparagine amidase n=1 Tax=Brachionus plicatilis TaxID=10195 RepID=A0A3M7SYA2_BRAPC|nr:Peptide-N(4)-(N-acetyl-beta-glucosaminyl)asparagine amidase [Brachionus plicatilis]
MSDSIGLSRIKENSKIEIQNVSKVLLDLLDNILKNPNESKFRKLKLESELIASKLMPFSGGLEILFEIGFQDEDDHFFLPDNFDPKILTHFYYLLKKVHDENSDKTCTPSPGFLCAQAIEPKRPEFGLKNIKNLSFANRLNQSFNHVMIYEDPDLKQKCSQKIPVNRLKSSAEKKYMSFMQDNQDKHPYNQRDFLVLELLEWFKNEFFRWINQPDCQSCKSNKAVVFFKNDKPNINEITWMAGNVEVYKCSNCQTLTRFPRYNHPSKLLDTRGGRCGEWANCFCLVLRSMDFDARYVLDWTDHVWCEVYSESQKRWLHADPCENTLDKPLVYEHGWNKQLTYIIAFSRYECLDVTWRYSAKHQEVLKRRNECDEMWLVNYTNEMTKKRIHLVNRKEREMRLVAELVEFLSPKVIKEGEDVGRQSGSLQWRISRGEIKAVNELINGFKFKIDKVPFTLKYNTAKNEYLKQNNDIVVDWKSLVYGYSNIRLKVEHDWKMCYLEREKGSCQGFLEWCFHLDLKARINLTFNWSVFESGEVKLKLIGINQSGQRITEINLDKSNLNKKNLFVEYKFWNEQFRIDFKDDVKEIIIRAELHNGNGQNAFQHAQLFRQSLSDIDKYLFEIEFL